MPYIERKQLKFPWMKPAKPYENANRVFNYNTTLWRNASKCYRQEHPLCELCLEKGLNVPSTITDHRQSIRSGGDPYNPANLQALCKQCHDKKTNREVTDRKRNPGTNDSLPGDLILFP